MFVEDHQPALVRLLADPSIPEEFYYYWNVNTRAPHKARRSVRGQAASEWSQALSRAWGRVTVPGFSSAARDFGGPETQTARITGTCDIHRTEWRCP